MLLEFSDPSRQAHPHSRTKSRLTNAFSNPSCPPYPDVNDYEIRNNRNNFIEYVTSNSAQVCRPSSLSDTAMILSCSSPPVKMAIIEATRFEGVTRPYTEKDVAMLQGSMKIEYTLANEGAKKLWVCLCKMQNSSPSCACPDDHKVTKPPQTRILYEVKSPC